MSFDPDALIAALPYRPQPQSVAEPHCLPRWRWPMLGPYNGFTGVERVELWRRTTWLKQRGEFVMASTCELCGSIDRLSQHAEDYSTIERMVTLCSGCHGVLHRRFRHPSPWIEVAERHPVTSWPLQIAMQPFNLAEWLRQKTPGQLDPSEASG